MLKRIYRFLFGYQPRNMWYSHVQWVGKRRPLLMIWSSVKGAFYTVALSIRTEWREAKVPMTEVEVQDMIRKLNGSK